LKAISAEKTNKIEATVKNNFKTSLHENQTDIAIEEKHKSTCIVELEAMEAKTAKIS